MMEKRKKRVAELSNSKDKGKQNGHEKQQSTETVEK